jgi:hypothetical protein
VYVLHHFLPADVDLFLKDKPLFNDHDLLEDRHDDRVAFLANGRGPLDDAVYRNALNQRTTDAQLKIDVFGPFLNRSLDQQPVGIAYRFIDAECLFENGNGVRLSFGNALILKRFESRA